MIGNYKRAASTAQLTQLITGGGESVLTPIQDGPFQISIQLQLQRMEWIIQQRNLILQDKQIELLELQRSATILVIIAEILGLLDLEIIGLTNI